MDKFQYGGLLFDPSHYQTLSYIESKHNNKLFINPDFKKGKAGYMQLSPIAFADLKEQGFFKDREYDSLTPQEVLAGSMKYASRLGEHYGFTDPKWNAAAYNMGPSKARELYDKYGGKLNKAVLDPNFPQTTKDYLFDYNYTTLAKDRHNNEDVHKMYDIIKNDQDVNSLNIDAMAKKNKTPKYFWGALIQAGVNKIKEEKAKDKAFMNSSNMGAAGTALGSMITSAGDAIGTQEDASKANVIQGAAVSTLGGLMSGGIMGGLIAAPTSLIKYSANAIAQGSRKETQQEAWINGHTTGIDTGTNYQFKMGGVPKYQAGGPKTTNPLYQDSLNLYTGNEHYENYLANQNKLYGNKILTPQEYQDIKDKYVKFYPKEANSIKKALINLTVANGEMPKRNPNMASKILEIHDPNTDINQNTVVIKSAFTKPTNIPKPVIDKIIKNTKTKKSAVDIPIVKNTIAPATIVQKLAEAEKPKVVRYYKDGQNTAVSTTDKFLTPEEAGFIAKKEKGGYSIEGYRKNSPDRNNDYNVIPGSNISMQDVLHKVLGIGSNGQTTGIDTGTNYQFKMGGMPKYHRGSDIYDIDPPQGNTFGVPVKDTIYPNGNNKFLFDKYKNPDYIVHTRNKGRELSAFEKTLDIADRVLSAPSRYMVQAVTGKYQDPSQAWGYQDPKGFMQNAANIGLDIVADPMNLLGAGLVKNTGYKVVPKLVKVGKAAEVVNDANKSEYIIKASKDLANEYMKKGNNLKDLYSGKLDDKFKDFINVAYKEIPEYKTVIEKSLKLNKPEATLALINDAIKVKNTATDTYDPHYSKTSDFGPLAAGYKGSPQQKQVAKITNKLTAKPAKQSQVAETIAATPSPMVMNQFNKIVNGKKVPISKEEFQAINSKGKVSTDTIPTYLRQIIPDSLQNKQKLLIKDITKKEKGGYSIEGYRKNSPDRNNDYNIIPGTNISMQNVLHKVLGIGSNGQTQIMLPGHQYNFGAATHVTEIPMKKYQEGGPPLGQGLQKFEDYEPQKEDLLNIPQHALMELLTGKRKSPSEILYEDGALDSTKISNRILGTLFDLAIDPLNYISGPRNIGIKGEQLGLTTLGKYIQAGLTVDNIKDTYSGLAKGRSDKYKKIDPQNDKKTKIENKQEGGPPDVVPMSQITPLQASKDELVIHPNYDVTKTAARKTHAEYTKTGQNEKVSDTLQPLQRDQLGNVVAPGAYVVSNAKELKIPVELAKQMSLGVDPAYYAKNEHLPEAKERNVADEFFNNKKEMTPAELLKSVLKKIPEPKRDSKTDIFAKQTSIMNKAARVPMLEIIKKTNDFLRNVNNPNADEPEAQDNPQEEMQDPNAEQMMYAGGVPKYQASGMVMPNYLNYPLYQDPNLNGGNVITGALRTPGDGNPLPATPDYSPVYAYDKPIGASKDWRTSFNAVQNSPEGAAIASYKQPAKAGSPATPDYMSTLLQQIQGRKYPGNANNAALANLAAGFSASMLSALQNPTNEVYATNPTLMDRKFAPEDINLRTRIYDNSMANRDAITLKGLESTGVSAQKSQFYLQSNDNIERRNAAILSAIQANNQLGRAKANAIDQNRRGIVDQNNANQRDYNKYLYNITKPIADTASNIGNVYQQDQQNRIAFDDRKERDMISVQQGQYMMDILNKQNGVAPAASGTTNQTTIPIFQGKTQEEWEAFKKKYNIA